MSVKTLNDIFTLTTATPRAAAMKYKKDGSWVDITVPELADTVRYLSTGLRVMGVKPDDRVAILSENRPEWTMSDFAILAAGAVSVPIYPTLLGWQIEYIINDSGAVVLIASSAEQLEKIHDIRGHCPSIQQVIVCEQLENLPSGTQTFQSVVASGRKYEAKEGRVRFDELLRSRTASDLATLVYTSGTTGNPKGAMLTHGNIAENAVSTAQLMPMRPGDIALSILPLSHILERTADFAFLYRGGCVAYAESVLKVGENLQEVKPDLFAAVPRLFEKMQAKIMDGVAMQPASKQKIFKWALTIAKARLPYRIENKSLPLTLKIKSAIADKLVFRKIHEKLGGRVRFVISGGAPLSAELAAFFIGAGVEILEGYGLTETSPVIAINTMKHRKIGTVGRVIPGVEVKIAEDGEILSRGPHIMKGYFNNPEATAQAIDSDGWFHTGDIGLLDDEGFLKITDRKKDIIINAYGKNIAPQPLEGLLKSSPLIGTPVLIGDRRRYLVALLVPNFEKLERDAREKGIAFSSRDELVGDSRVIAMFQTEIDRFNMNLDRQEKVRRFALLPSDFSIESGEITPSMKVKRKVVDEKFKALIDEMYVDEASMSEA
ncbi:MAG TPA: long-chain fatty acid--CoA ligase [Thermoanaerobaculia bacterium]|nr:long-chain fatty acid--CoA ligase [Thermoanaerobaculia bacterium]